jgi:hypothetical protein
MHTRTIFCIHLPGLSLLYSHVKTAGLKGRPGFSIKVHLWFHASRWPNHTAVHRTVGGVSQHRGREYTNVQVWTTQFTKEETRNLLKLLTPQKLRIPLHVPSRPPLLYGDEVSYGPPWAHYLGGYQERLLGGPLGLPDLCRTVPDAREAQGLRWRSTRIGSYTYHVMCKGLPDVHD